MSPWVHRGWVALGVGYDTNINSANTPSDIALPILGGRRVALPSELLVAHASPLFAVSGGASGTLPIDPANRVTASGSAQIRLHPRPEVIAYAPHQYLGTIAYEHSTARSEWSLIAGIQQQWLARYHAMARQFLAGQVATRFAPQWEGTFGVEWRTTTYPYFSSHAANGPLVRTSLTYIPWRVSAGVTVNQETAGKAAPELERTTTSLGLGWKTVIDAWQVGTSLASTASHYASASPFFLVTRHDRSVIAVVEGGRRLTQEWRNWRFTTRLIHERNDSNIALSAYNRTQVMFEFSRDY